MSNNNSNYTYTYGGNNYNVPTENIARLKEDEKNAIINYIIQYGAPTSNSGWADIFRTFTNNDNAGDTSTDLFNRVKNWATSFVNSNKSILGYDSEGYVVDGQGGYIYDNDGGKINYKDYKNGNYLGGENYDYTKVKKPDGSFYTSYEDYFNSLPDAEKEKKTTRLDEAQDIAYNSYWNNLFDRNRENSLGKEAYDQLLQAEQNNAQNAIDLANAQTQQLAIAQAQTVKNITDQVRAERMSRLRAGMSESQIASQDMQQMIANTNALNDQIAASNMSVLQGQQQLAGAQQTAYQNWLNAMNQTGTTASAMAAADGGDAYMQTLKRMNKTGESYKVANNYVTGQTNNTTK